MLKSWLPEFSHQDFEILQKETLYQGFLTVQKYQLRFRCFQGGFSHPVSRELLSKDPAVAVFLYDPKKDKVVMIEQFRVGALQDTESPWVLEIVAGVVDANETNESTAYREAKEEANCDILSLRHICTYHVSPGISNEITSVYCGFIEAPNETGFYGLLEDGEDIKVHIMSGPEVIQLFRQGKITSASAVIAIQWFELNRETLRASQ